MLLNMWGRAKVRDLEDAYAADRRRDKQRLMQQIVDVSLESHVLSRFTAFVAVDRTETVKQAGKQAQIIQPVEMPAGWEESGAFTGMALAGSRMTLSTRSLAKRSITDSRVSDEPDECADSLMLSFDSVEEV